MPRRFALAAGLAGVITIVGTLPMFGEWRVGGGLMILALPGLTAVGALFGYVHPHVAILTLLATWIIYFAVFLIVTMIWRLLRA